MAATVQLSIATGAGPTVVLADTIKHSREDSKVGTTAIPVPTTAGVNYGWYKTLYFDVTVVASPATSISNRTLKIDSAMSTGLREFFKTAASYVQATNANRPADTSGSNTATPAGYTICTTTSQQYDGASASGGTLGRNGAYGLLVLAVGADYGLGTSTAASMPSMTWQYDEA